MGENLCSYTYDNDLLTRFYYEPKKLNSQKINAPMKKWANEHRTFSKEEFQMAKNT
jgi:hypothetical protein